MNRIPTRPQGQDRRSAGYDPSLPRLGERILDKYEIFEISEGGFGYVLGVTDLTSGEEFAVKIPKQQATSQSAEAFAKEVAIWVDLKPHPNIITARFVREIDHRPGLFMEYVRGTAFRTLRELLPMGRLSTESAVQFAYQLCRGMEFANRGRELVHLDLKPENLMIADGTVLKITDFGLAHRVRITDGHYERRSAGSWPYAPPERYRNQPCDTRSDMFSVGVIFYEMLTGVLPYPFTLADDPSEAYAQLAAFHAEDGMDPIANRLYQSGLPGVNPDITGVMSAFLSCARHDRPMHFRKTLHLFEELGVRQTQISTDGLLTDEPLARVAALQAVGEHSAALSILNQLLIKEPSSGAYYMAAARSLAATGQDQLAKTFRDRARQHGHRE